MSAVDRHRRRRRSAAGLRALVEPADIPGDAEGRVEFVAIRIEEDHPAIGVDGGPPEPDAGHAAERGEAGPEGRGWSAVVAVGAVLVIVFLVGILITR